MSTYKRLPSFSASSSLLTRPHTVPARWILRRGMIMAAVIFSTYANRSIESGSTPRIDTDNWKGLPAMGAWRRGRRRCLEPGREKEEGDSGFSCSIVSQFTVFLGLGLVRFFRFRSCPGTVQGQDRVDPLGSLNPGLFPILPRNHSIPYKNAFGWIGTVPES